jgi:uncharacterized lipoprotein
MHATREELLEIVFSVRSVQRINNDEQLQLRQSVESESRSNQTRAAVVGSGKMADEAGDSSGTQKDWSVGLWKQSSDGCDSKHYSLHVTDLFNVVTSCVHNSAMNRITSLNKVIATPSPTV